MRTMKRIFEFVIAMLMFSGVFIGIILMMCETDDPQKQAMVTISGFVIFCLAMTPGLIIAIVTNLKERRRNRSVYGRTEEREPGTDYSGSYNVETSGD